MKIFEAMSEMGHEQVLFGSDPAAGYRGILAIHSTVLGPAVGGTRLWRYSAEQEALVDALRLSRGMTYKNAVAGLPLGGGKAVLLAARDPGSLSTSEREALFRAHGRFVDRLGGRFLTGEDVGTTPADLEHVRKETAHAAGLACGSGDPSPHTARGVFRGMQAAARRRWGSDSLGGRTVAVQGCGSVGYHLARELHAAGARLIVTDIDAARVERLVKEFGAADVKPDEIYTVPADIFAPCALGGTINDGTLGQLRAQIVAGAANNQLLEERHGEELERRGIVYAPDFVINAGGVISGCVELLGWDAARVRTKIDGIYETTMAVFALAEAESIPASQAANRLAERRLQSAVE